MTLNPAGCTFEFGDTQGGDPQAALKKHFLGGQVQLQANQAGVATLDFLIEPNQEGILPANGVPPQSLTIKDPGGEVIFSGKASGVQRPAGSNGRQVTLTYHDPLHWELADSAPYAYPAGTIKKIYDHVSNGKNLNLKVDEKLNTELPAGGGKYTSLLGLLVDLSGLLGGFVYYDPKGRTLRIQSWSPGTTLALKPEEVVQVVQQSIDARSIQTSLAFFGRKGLKQDWTETKVNPKQAAVTPGSMGSELGAWSRAAEPSVENKRLLVNRVPSQAKSLAENALGARMAMASSVALTTRGIAPQVGATLKIPAHPDFAEGEIIVAGATYEFESSQVTGMIEGVRS